MAASTGSQAALNTLTAREGSRPGSATSAGSPRLALVVDDEPLVRSLVSSVLRHTGWSVIEAPDAATALRVAPETLGLLVTDYEVPVLSGLALAEHLRLRNSVLPVVMVSGHHDAEGRMSSVQGPRTALVGKPFPVEELIATVGAVTH